MGKTIARKACPSCKSSDNLCVFLTDDGREIEQCKTPNCLFNKPKVESTYQALEDRGISQATCEKLSISVQEIYGQKAHIYDYVTGKKFRILPKQFGWIDKKPQQVPLFGLPVCQNLDKPLLLTEGELDAASCWEAGYQACSLSSGAASGKKEILENLDKLLTYKEIWLGFDNDSAGTTVTQIALEVLPLNKIKIINWGKYKDANEALLAGDLSHILLNNVTEWVPNGIIFGKDLNLNQLRISPPPGLDLPWPQLNEAIKGLHRGMLYLLGAGSSIGKSSIMRELVYYLHTKYDHLKIANLFLEETQVVSPLSYIAIDNNVPLGDLLINRDIISDENWNLSFEKLIKTENLMFTSAQYNLNSTDLINSIEYLANVKKYDIIVLDHISLVISGTSLSKAGERRDIDELMHGLSALVKKLGIVVIAACHLSNPDKGLGWDEGREVGLYDLKGSSALAQKPDVVIGIERNMKDQFKCDQLKIRLLKNRWFGKLGEVDTLLYFEKSGRLLLGN